LNNKEILFDKNEKDSKQIIVTKKTHVNEELFDIYISSIIPKTNGTKYNNNGIFLSLFTKKCRQKPALDIIK
jgi:hypothetical protein